MKMKKLVVAYRNNGLFNKYISGILARVPADISVEKHIFTAGTNIEVIKQNLIPQLKDTKFPFLYLHDVTCDLFTLDDSSLKVKEHQADIRTLNLENAFSEIVEAVFESQDFVTIFKRVSKLIIQKPSHIYILKENIADHFDGFKNCEELADQYLWKTEKFANFIKGILEEIYPNVEIEIDYPGFDDCHSDHLLVVDRHHPVISYVDEMYDAFDITTWKYKLALLMLPFENTIAHLVTLGKIDEPFDSAVLYEKIFEDVDFS